MPVLWSDFATYYNHLAAQSLLHSNYNKHVQSDIFSVNVFKAFHFNYHQKNVQNVCVFFFVNFAQSLFVFRLRWLKIVQFLFFLFHMCVYKMPEKSQSIETDFGQCAFNTNKCLVDHFTTEFTLHWINWKNRTKSGSKKKKKVSKKNKHRMNKQFDLF